MFVHSEAIPSSKDHGQSVVVLYSEGVVVGGAKCFFNEINKWWYGSFAAFLFLLDWWSTT